MQPPPGESGLSDGDQAVEQPDGDLRPAGTARHQRHQPDQIERPHPFESGGQRAWQLLKQVRHPRLNG
ncbi:hypothetical protein GCM10010195_21510 [Kitasatospora griseola]|nr:hypothetical protein GCM10010195_21510 [Kitasatospora griseola]